MSIIAMLDSETLGVKPGCPIAQIACILWCTERNQVIDTFETFIRVNMNDPTADESTLVFWDGQDQELRQYVLANPDSTYEVSGLGNFYIWHAQLEEKPAIWWCKGIDFDFPIIETKLRQHGFTAPWKYNNRRDFRTVLKGFGYDTSSEFPSLFGAPENLRKHDAMADCWNQLAALVHIGFTTQFNIAK